MRTSVDKPRPLKRGQINEPEFSPAYWIEVARDAYVAGVDEALGAIEKLVEMEAAGRNYIPACQWGTPKPYDLQDISRAVYWHWRRMAI